MAPLGNLSLNAEQLSLLPGSLTSVSARGLVMPHGGTVDGVAYAYGGKPVVPNRPGEYGKIALSGKLDAAPGSRIDLSGGASCWARRSSAVAAVPAMPATRR